MRVLFKNMSEGQEALVERIFLKAASEFGIRIKGDRLIDCIQEYDIKLEQQITDEDGYKISVKDKIVTFEAADKMRKAWSGFDVACLLAMTDAFSTGRKTPEVVITQNQNTILYDFRPSSAPQKYVRGPYQWEYVRGTSLG